ncbi:chitinase [Enterobacter sp. ENT03]|uniref:chitinase n=1 Tax=Enterobacter sp. ENT03 TaxID=2854780 RepID=UPI001C485FA5|nr:chitinase [Enterobacter sp. ENT03]MBV7407003.1 chitinase [Enterobacter sp. ENT03]
MKTLITPYIDVTINAEWSDWENYPAGRPNPLYSQQAIDWKVDGLILAFITLSTSRKPCWAAQDAMPLDWALPLANDLNAAGRKVIVSFGGAANNDISTALSVDQLISTYQETIDHYHAVGLDFDLENGLYNVTNICEALKTIQQNNPGVQLSFTLPTLPSGLTGTGLSIIQNIVNAGLNFVVNGMAMDYYDPAYFPQMGKAATDAATSINNQLASLGVTGGYQCVAVTPMIGLNDDLSMFTLDDASTVASFAKDKRVNFIGMWSFNRDNPSSYSYVDLITSSNPEQKTSGDYSRTFVSGVAV